VQIRCWNLCRVTISTSKLPVSKKSLQGTALSWLTSIESIMPKARYVPIARSRCTSIFTWPLKDARPFDGSCDALADLFAPCYEDFYNELLN
jgi:hypothetical protein